MPNLAVRLVVDHVAHLLPVHAYTFNAKTNVLTPHLLAMIVIDGQLRQLAEFADKAGGLTLNISYTYFAPPVRKRRRARLKHL